MAATHDNAPLVVRVLGSGYHSLIVSGFQCGFPSEANPLIYLASLAKL
jgi:hypothetical protein